jgi:hypothetical protein
MSLPQLPLRAIVGAIPATIVILVGALVILPALFLSKERQNYALRVWKGVVELVSVLVGAHGRGIGGPGA